MKRRFNPPQVCSFGLSCRLASTPTKNGCSASEARQAVGSGRGAVVKPRTLQRLWPDALRLPNGLVCRCWRNSRKTHALVSVLATSASSVEQRPRAASCEALARALGAEP